jgi:hypothetical protein
MSIPGIDEGLYMAGLPKMVDMSHSPVWRIRKYLSYLIDNTVKILASPINYAVVFIKDLPLVGIYYFFSY